MVRILCAVSVIVLLSNGFCEAFSGDSEKFWPSKRLVILDRTVDGFKSPGYYMLPEDKTTFSVSRAIWLKQFDISKIFVYDPTKEVPIDHVRVNFKIVQLLKTDPTRQREIFSGNTALSSTHEANVQLNILLKPDFDYEIRIEMPENLQLMYTNFLEIREFKINKWFGRSIYVNFYQHNSGEKPPVIEDDKRKKSQGIVNRIYLRNPWF